MLLSSASLQFLGDIYFHKILPVAIRINVLFYAMVN